MKKALLIIYSIALLTCLPNGALGADVCVDNAADLQNALTAAESSGETDIIRVVQGAYYGNFSYTSSEGHSLTLLGGHTDGCFERDVNPPNTVFDAHCLKGLFLADHMGQTFICENF